MGLRALHEERLKEAQLGICLTFCGTFEKKWKKNVSGAGREVLVKVARWRDVWQDFY